MMKIVLGSAGEFVGKNDEPNGRREFRVRLVRGGQVVQADGEPGPFVIPAEVIQTAVFAGRFDGLAVFVDHPRPFETASVKALVGVTHSAVFNEETQSADAVIRFYSNDTRRYQPVVPLREKRKNSGFPEGNMPTVNVDLADAMVSTLDMMLADVKAGIEPPNVGLSLVFWPQWETARDDNGPLVLAAFKRVDSADIVFSPAADGRILEALSTYNGTDLRPRPYSLELGENDFIGTERGFLRSNEIGDKNLMELEANDVVERSEGGDQVGRDRIQEWVEAARRSAVPAILQRSGLPARSDCAAVITNRPRSWRRTSRRSWLISAVWRRTGSLICREAIHEGLETVIGHECRR